MAKRSVCPKLHGLVLLKRSITKLAISDYCALTTTDWAYYGAKVANKTAKACLKQAFTQKNADIAITETMIILVCKYLYGTAFRMAHANTLQVTKCALQLRSKFKTAARMVEPMYGLVPGKSVAKMQDHVANLLHGSLLTCEVCQGLSMVDFAYGLQDWANWTFPFWHPAILFVINKAMYKQGGEGWTLPNYFKADSCGMPIATIALAATVVCDDCAQYVPVLTEHHIDPECDQRMGHQQVPGASLLGG
jgi:hypothetical protein